MKGRTVLFIVLFLLVVLMAHKPKKTTLQITNGEMAAENVVSAAIGGLFGGTTAGKKGH